MEPHSLSDDLRRLEKHYGRLLDEHGDSPQAVQYTDETTHRRRFEVLAEIGVPSDAKVLDWGCGTGALLSHLRDAKGFRGEFVGYDLSAGMVSAAHKKFPDARFERRNIFEEGIPEAFDYVFVSGVFNSLISDNEAFLREALSLLFGQTRRALAFNAMSTYVDFLDEGLYYYDPEKVFRFCKETLSPLVTLRHDFLIKPNVPPFEFAVYVHRCEQRPRTKLEG